MIPNDIDPPLTAGKLQCMAQWLEKCRGIEWHNEEEFVKSFMGRDDSETSAGLMYLLRIMAVNSAVVEDESAPDETKMIAKASTAKFLEIATEVVNRKLLELSHGEE